MIEARLEDSGSGLAPVTEGWFIVNVREAQWWSSDTRGAACWFANEYGEPPVEFEQLGINVTVLEPGQSGVYHAETNQEAFLVLAGESRLIVEGEERRLRAWDFFHCPPWTEHAFVGAGNGPCVILMVGAHSGPERAVPGVGTRGALRRECGRGNLRSGAGLCDGRAVPARAAAVLGSASLGLTAPGVIPAHWRPTPCPYSKVSSGLQGGTGGSPGVRSAGRDAPDRRYEGSSGCCLVGVAGRR